MTAIAKFAHENDYHKLTNSRIYIKLNVPHEQKKRPHITTTRKISFQMKKK